jgi:hypothetical protein
VYHHPSPTGAPSALIWTQVYHHPSPTDAPSALRWTQVNYPPSTPHRCAKCPRMHSGVSLTVPHRCAKCPQIDSGVPPTIHPPQVRQVPEGHILPVGRAGGVLLPGLSVRSGGVSSCGGPQVPRLDPQQVRGRRVRAQILDAPLQRPGHPGGRGREAHVPAGAQRGGGEGLQLLLQSAHQRHHGGHRPALRDGHLSLPAGELPPMFSKLYSISPKVD